MEGIKISIQYRPTWRHSSVPLPLGLCHTCPHTVTLPLREAIYTAAQNTQAQTWRCLQIPLATPFAEGSFRHSLCCVSSSHKTTHPEQGVMEILTVNLKGTCCLLPDTFEQLPPDNYRLELANQIEE